MVISLNGLLGRDCGRTKRIVFTLVRKRDYTPETLNRVFEIFAWSVNRMAVGKNPLLDWDRRPIGGAIESPLAGPYTAILTQVRGDWAFYVEFFFSALEWRRPYVLDVPCFKLQQAFGFHRRS